MFILAGCSARSSDTLTSEESAVWWGSEYTAYDDDPDAGYVASTDFASGNETRRRSSRNPMDSSSRSLLIDTAQVALGTPYVPGGSSLRGFDCSGFVQWAYKSLGVTLPRSARDQAYYGTPVRKDELKTGDIVAFRHPRRGYHTGIYVGDGMFIHSPSRNKSVQIVPLNSAYYRENYLGARRCPLPSDKVKLEEAAARLKEHKAIKASIRTERRTYAYSSYSSPRSSRSSSRYMSSYTKSRSARNVAVRETSKRERQAQASVSNRKHYSVKNSNVRNAGGKNADVRRSSEKNSKNRVTGQNAAKYQPQPKNTPKRGAPSGRTSVSSSKDSKGKSKTTAVHEGRPARSKRAS